MVDFRSQANALRDNMIARRRDFHQHPELSFQEVRTAGIVAEELSRLGLEVQTGVGKTGVVALLEGDHEGPTVLVRCDMDALPIEEENETDYRSQKAQTMHACGHDGHTTVALAVAKMLSQQRENMNGTIKFIFQPAEEIGLGALAMIEDGILLDPVPEVSIGLHLWNELPVGEVAVTPGPIMAGADTFDVHIKGRGGHGGMPHQTADPVIAMAHIVTALQTIVSRNVPPVDTAVVSPTRIRAGEVYNIIPDSVDFAGTIRTFTNEVHELVIERLHALVEGIAVSMGCQAEVVSRCMTLPVVNDAQVASRLKSGFVKSAPDLVYHDNFMTMAAEDMAYILEKVPGVFMMVGSANASRGLNYAHHHPRFDFDEEAMVIGASLLASAVAEYVLPG